MAWWSSHHRHCWPTCPWWFYVGVPPGLLVSFRELVYYGLWIGGLCIAGLACCYFWPTSVPPHGIELVDYPGFGLLRGIDASANACPSMHVATATFSAIWLDCLLREIGMRVPARFLNGCWFALIVYSTLAIKQHVVLDVIAGLALGKSRLACQTLMGEQAVTIELLSFV